MRIAKENSTLKQIRLSGLGFPLSSRNGVWVLAYMRIFFGGVT